MTARESRESGRKEQILESALHLFLEEGYDSTSMRKIADAAGCAVGLAYHYFETKDEMFAQTLDYFFQPYEQEMRVLAAQKDKDLYGLLEDCFSYVVKQSSAFRKNHPGELHWMVRQALRERALELLEKTVMDILNGDAADGVWLALPVEDAAALLGQGLGSLLLQESAVRGAFRGSAGDSHASKESQLVQTAMRAARQILGDAVEVPRTSQILNPSMEDPSRRPAKRNENEAGGNKKEKGKKKKSKKNKQGK